MTTPFKTTPEQILNLASIMVEMRNVGLEHAFIVKASKLAESDQGVYDLMELWFAESDDSEREEIVADIQESIDDYADAPQEPIHKPYIKYNRLDDVARRVMTEKARLRQIIDRHGGVSAVAKKSGIPQPSLSRMLSSPSIPRRSTLYKIANALGLSEEDVVMEWNR
jgi:DNA-binding phage protein